MTDVSTFSAFELFSLPKNQLEGLPLYMSLVSLSILGLNPTDCRLSGLLKQICFGKTSLAAIIQHCQGAINKIGIFMFFLNWYHTHTDNIFLDGCWCTCNFSSTISWFFFIELTASWHWFYALWLVSMQFCWMIFLSHTANSSPLVVFSTIVLTYWFVAAKKKLSASSETSFCLQLPSSYSCSRHQGHEPSDK